MATRTHDDEQTVSIDGRKLRITRLDKVLYPETGTTKADVLDYFVRIADTMIPHTADRPATRKRWVHGVGTTDQPGQVFFQKNLDASAPHWIASREIQHRDHTNTYPLVNDRATLAWFAQMAALEIHVPQWRFGRTGAHRNPDRFVLDLDPGEGAGLQECAEVARIARSILVDMGLDPMPVTSGSKGIHLYAALDESRDSDAISAVAHELARALEADHPDLIVSDMKKALRGGKVLVDWSQNNASKTTIAPYSLRGRSHPMVAAPRTWEELDDPQLRHLDYTEVLERVATMGDPLAGLTAGHFDSLEPTAAHMATFAATPETENRLEKYRSMRNAAKTAEPMGDSPTATPSPDAPTFVIQEHHARRLHYDFRLEHDGVLVSWALPKGVPTDPAKNHLAVQTEDHPLDYGAFEGTIPAGEYGAGDVTIWDSGTYDLEKWREGKEVIVTIDGERHGRHRYALIHTGAEPQTWLIHLMEKNGSAPAPKRAASRTAAPAPMLASVADSGQLGMLAHDKDDWAFEMKWDGIRCIATVEDGEVRLTSRNGNDLTVTYPELSELATAVEGDAVLDGEIVALNRKGRPDFGTLQQRMGVTRAAEVEAAREKNPVQLMVFDVLRQGNESLLPMTYDVRRERLQSAVTENSTIRVPDAFSGDLDAAMATSIELGLEGVMAKRRTSSYTPGRRSRSWIKIKHHHTQEVVIGGWRPGKGARSGLVGSLLLGVPTDEGLRYVGRVGTGFTEKQLEAAAAKMRRLERKSSPFIEVPGADARDAHWVTPSLVGEVEFSEWTATQRLRHPTWRGWRPDKDPDDVTIEQP
ncbi:ATP-dependent DNA ligase [Homoserinimonas hongtaonis]|uniref:ATP-dependent DNA ligase n=1 Tax=Homoserinimonas hongtaonis TaxID=2079791 RepID=UPI000D3B1762|nr:ATP-dependent DNA ligase [Salinibacterium hongtaonis]AWB89551.1 ATP-dependent DNA ligase [Salinibacterium hongtaonis]